MQIALAFVVFGAFGLAVGGAMLVTTGHVGAIAVGVLFFAFSAAVIAIARSAWRGNRRARWACIGLLLLQAANSIINPRPSLFWGLAMTAVHLALAIVVYRELRGSDQAGAQVRPAG